MPGALITTAQLLDRVLPAAKVSGWEKSTGDFRRDALMRLSRELNYPLAPPDWVSVNVTLRCNLTCEMCTTCYPIKNELTYDEIVSIIDQTADWGVGIFNPLGGEPFLRKDMLDILEHGERRGLFVTVTTNGTRIFDEDARRLAGLHRVHMNVSLDGLRAVNDRIRGPGVFDKALETIRLVREHETRLIEQGKLTHRKRINVNSIIHDRNLDELPEFVDTMRATGADKIQFLFLFGYDEARGEDNANDMWIKGKRLDDLDRVLDELERKRQGFKPGSYADGGFGYTNTPDNLELARQYYRGKVTPHEAPCYNGFKELYINADGRGLMCDGKLNFDADSFGNARTQTLKEMWTSMKAHEMRKKVLGCTHACIQGCYLRADSDDLKKIATGASRAFLSELRNELRTFGQTGVRA